MSPALAVATAVTFTWLGMVLAISFLEAPLKFGAPGVTVRIGLGIGRRVFRALNAVETVLAAALLGASLLGAAPGCVRLVVGSVVVVLAVQLLGVRPGLNRRSDQILAGGEVPRSRGHLTYVVLEAAKVVALVVTGVLLVSA